MSGISRTEARELVRDTVNTILEAWQVTDAKGNDPSRTH